MTKSTQIIAAINNSCSILFTESSFRLSPVTNIFQHNSASRFRFSSGNTSLARTNYNSIEYEEVKVIRWFDDFWIYIDIHFIDSNTFITLSVFQGEENDNIKHQLFRAEWDDYNNCDEKHPQPHWHITANQAIEKTFNELANLEIEQSDTFANLLKEEKSKIINMNNFHFAMNGNWINNETHIHSLNTQEKIVLWFKGLLPHLRDELKYLKR